MLKGRLKIENNNFFIEFIEDKKKKIYPVNNQQQLILCKFLKYIKEGNWVDFILESNETGVISASLI